VDQPDSYNTQVRGADNAVSDLKLSFFYERVAGDGPLKLRMTKLDRTFVATIDAGNAAVVMVDKAGKETAIGSYALKNERQPMRVDFINVDYRVTLRINDKDVIASTREQYRPDPRDLLARYEKNEVMPPPSVEILADKQKGVLSHVSLWRDIYYTNRRLYNGVPDQWPTRVVHLSKVKGLEEYFVLGDNSIISGDARYWTRPIQLPEEGLDVPAGRVPARFLLGKAFFVYWPAGFRPFAESPGVIPDFGDMRFIH
jgi:hypothetical protein